MTPGSFWSGRRPLVTGATGIVGSWLCQALLQEGAHVVALVLDSDPQSEFFRSGTASRCTIVNGRLECMLDLDRALNLHAIDTVFHLAAQTQVTVAHRNPLPTFEANIRGTYNLLETCRLLGDAVERVVVASSDKAYGEQPHLPYREDMPLSGRHPYEVSKSCADLIAQSYHHTYAMPVAIARCGNIYGGGDLNWDRIVPGTIAALHRGERPVLRSDGTHLRDYIYVRDVVGAYMRLAERLDQPGIAGAAFNFGHGSGLSVLDLVAAIRRLMGREDIEPLVCNNTAGELRAQWLCADRARELLGWTPSYDLEPGLRETIAWYANYLNAALPAGADA